MQPYGLVVPPSYSPNAPHRWRLDTWFHGRNETLSEINFLADRMRNPGEFTPRDTIVLHLYGRFCNASKMAGEVDLFEALDAVKRHYAIDENRILVRGFSMGGGSAWHIGTHYAGLWAAVAPGAGFSESAQFLHLKLTGDNAPPEWEQKLFHVYDATDYAMNLYNTSTVAYNGEIDPQKQAADMMEKAHGRRGLAADSRGRVRRRRTATIPIPRSRSTACSTRLRSAGATRIRARCGSPPGRWPITR